MQVKWSQPPPSEQPQNIYDSDDDDGGHSKVTHIRSDLRKQPEQKQSTCDSDTDAEGGLGGTKGSSSDATELPEWRRQPQQAARQATPMNDAQVEELVQR
jgi:hypothetical protein